jgi:hypothetical protein
MAVLTRPEKVKRMQKRFTLLATHKWTLFFSDSSDEFLGSRCSAIFVGACFFRRVLQDIVVLRCVVLHCAGEAE